MKSDAFPTRIANGIVEEFGKTEVICFCKQENLIVVSIWNVLRFLKNSYRKKISNILTFDKFQTAVEFIILKFIDLIEFNFFMDELIYFLDLAKN